MAPSRIPRTQHLDDASCHDDQTSECSPYPAPVLPAPLPHPPPSSPPGSDGRSTLVTALVIAGSALAFVILCLSVFLFVRRRRRRQALLEATAAPAVSDGGQNLGEAEQGEVVHHAWHIRTVGLDKAAIESIALTRYRAGAGGALGASDCAVCLSEFADGELLRLLPRCAHAFHVRCVDTWLRAHVNCPLCRSQVLDPAPDAGQAASSDVTTGHEQPDRQASEQRELRFDQDDGRSISPEQQPHRDLGPRGGDFRRVASMDSQPPIEEAAPEADEQAGGNKQGTGGVLHREFPPSCSARLKNHRGMKRSLSVGSRWALVPRHHRRSGSLLPS